MTESRYMVYAVEGIWVDIRSEVAMPLQYSWITGITAEKINILGTQYNFLQPPSDLKGKVCMKDKP